MQNSKLQFKIQNLFSFFLILTSFFLLLNPVYAQEVGSPSAEIITTAKSDYQLAYPGLLPDHQLYFLKAARDKIISIFISNPVKKAEFDLLQTDKRIAASLFLVQKNKVDLSQSTFSKGENYFEDGLNRAYDAKSQGVNVSELAKKFVIANSKHQEVLQSINIKINDNNKKKFVEEHARLIELGKKAKELSKQ